MAVYQREKISVDMEKDIVIGLIVSHEYCRDAFPMLRPEHFTSKHLRRLMMWVKDYYKQYKEAPLNDIQKIFTVEGSKLDDDERELIEILLSDISDKYVEQLKTGNGTFNSPYLLDITRKHCRSRNINLLMNEIDGYITKGQVDKADKALKDFSQIMAATSQWINPLKTTTIADIMAEDYANRLFIMPGKFGELAGWFERGWLIAYFGPMKRGKSFYLQDMGIRALEAGLKVVYVSLEMSAKNVAKRFYSKITAHGRRAGIITFPIFDCRANQDGSCQLPERVNDIALIPLDSDDDLPFFDRDKHKDYRVCTYCRAKRLPDYIPSTWFEEKDIGKIETKVVVRKAATFKKMFGDNFRIIAYPPFSVDFDQIISDIEDLEQTDSFVPDLICIDYLDIMANEKGQLSERGQVDTRWKRAKGLGSTKHCAVATVSQTGRASFVKEDIDETDTSEDIRKLAHLDIGFGLNQTISDKRRGVMRINVFANRHDDFDIRRQIIVLQSLKSGQPFIDAEYDPRTYKFLYGTKETKKQKKQRRVK
jgi:hypothetical protein